MTLCTCHTTGSYGCPEHEPDPPSLAKRGPLAETPDADADDPGDVCMCVCVDCETDEDPGWRPCPESLCERPDHFHYGNPSLIARCEEYEAALQKIAAPKRPDGTYNLSREACERIAREALGD